MSPESGCLLVLVLDVVAVAGIILTLQLWNDTDAWGRFMLATLTAGEAGYAIFLSVASLRHYNE